MNEPGHDLRSEVGELLVDRGVLTVEALARPVVSESVFFAQLIEDAACSEGALVAFLAERSGFPGIDLSMSALLLSALDLIPRPVAEGDQILPLSTEGGRLHLAVTDPEAANESIDEVRFITGMEISLYIALPAPLERCILAAFDARERGETLWRGAGIAADAPPRLAIVSSSLTLDALSHGLSTHSAVYPTSGPIARAPAPEAAASAPHSDHSLATIQIEIGDETGEHEQLIGSVRTGPKRILIVDDEPDIIRLLSRALQIKGYLVESASDGALAEARLDKEPLPDLVLLDAMLPHVHGFEVCQRLKANKARRAVQVIMMSAVYRGWRFAQDVKESYGADDFVEKPFHLADLLRRVDERLAEGKSVPPPTQAVEKLYRAGVDALSRGNAEESRTALESAARIDPFAPRVQFALAQAYVAQGDVYRAISAYERAVELRPKLFAALKNLSALYLEKGFRTKATETLERAFSAAPDPKARDEIRILLERLG